MGVEPTAVDAVLHRAPDVGGEGIPDEQKAGGVLEAAGFHHVVKVPAGRAFPPLRPSETMTWSK